MLAGFLEALKPREERVELGGHVLVVREAGKFSDLAALKGKDDSVYRMLVLCTFAEDGTPAFTEADLADLKSCSQMRLLPLVEAVNRVNGFDLKDNEKK